MTRIIIVLVFLLTGYANGAEQAAPEPSEPVNTKRQSQEKAKKAITPPSPQGRKENWPKPFVPSERIGADSVVSFPVDI